MNFFFFEKNLIKLKYKFFTNYYFHVNDTAVIYLDKSSLTSISEQQSSDVYSIFQIIY